MNRLDVLVRDVQAAHRHTKGNRTAKRAVVVRAVEHVDGRDRAHVLVWGRSSILDVDLWISSPRT